MPKVSIIIPAFNAERTLHRALHSVLGQTFEDYDVVIVDDASEPPLELKLDRAAEKRVRLIGNPENLGAGPSRNVAISAGDSELIAFLDADDVWLPNKLSAQIEMMDHAPSGCEAGFGPFFLERPSSGERVLCRPGLPQPDRQFDAMLLGCSISPGSTLIVRRTAFDEIGPFDSNLRRLEDWDWLIRFTKRFWLCMTDAPVAVVADHRGYHEKNTLAALAYMKEKYESDRDFLPNRRQRAAFRSTILIEKSSLKYRKGARMRAGWYLLRALATYPRRGASILTRIVSRLRRPGRRSTAWHGLTAAPKDDARRKQ